MTRQTTILIVDDNHSLARTLDLILQRRGYNVQVAYDGPTAIEKVRQGPVDIMLLDIKMPVMNGLETYKNIKLIRPDLIVMMMTAYTVDNLVAEALAAGAHQVLYKPLDIENTIDLIETAMLNKFEL